MNDIVIVTTVIPNMRRTSMVASQEVGSRQLLANVIENVNVIAAMAVNGAIIIPLAAVAAATIIRHSTQRLVHTIHTHRTISSNNITRT